jgi:predicted transcriptional regulator
MSNVAIRFTLKQLLDTHDITPYQLSKESNVSLNTVYAITKDKTKRIDKDTLDALIRTLEDLTGKHLEVSDIMSFER